MCANTPKKVGEFVNTWSVDGFISEGYVSSDYPVEKIADTWACCHAN